MNARPLQKTSPDNNDTKNESGNESSSIRSSASSHPSIRHQLLQALHADLIGPYDPDSPTEILDLKPSQWYLTGFLVPETHRETLGQRDPNESDDVGSGNDDRENSPEETVQKQPKCFPASMGLSVFVPKPATLEIELTWAEYIPDDAGNSSSTSPSANSFPPDLENRTSDTSQTSSASTWRRVPRGPYRLSIDLEKDDLIKGITVPNSPGIFVQGRCDEINMHGNTPDIEAPDKARALSIFVINRRAEVDPKKLDENILFQAEMKLTCQEGFLPRPNRVGLSQDADPDDQIADLHYRHQKDFAVGHGVSWKCHPPSADGRVTCIATSWIPISDVKKVKTRELDNPETGPLVETKMEVLANLENADAVREKLGALPQAYGQWIAEQRQQDVGHPLRREVRDALMHRADEAKNRIQQGIERLATNEQLRSTFCWANQAMARASRQQRSDKPKWRLFQLAFILLNLSGIEDPHHHDRETVELIFFPTGGGKTEAYLGVIAVTLLWRRLQAQTQQRPDGGLGVSVILRYTLRLLTLDQLERAAALICSLELLRTDHPQKLGETRFAIGLWVGSSATPNRLKDARSNIEAFKNARGANPCPLTHCPWCKTTIEADSLTVYPSGNKPTEVRVCCMEPQCAFSGRATNGLGLPVVFVDEQIYQELPAFLIATVDKFAMLPWLGDTGKFFGRVLGHDGISSRRFYGPTDRKKGSCPLPAGLFPPDLIVQDELHLISGPLGTMVGLYETGIEILCTRYDAREPGKPIKPKIIASTATVRRASDQVKSLFGRTSMQLFPPSGIDAFETYFAQVDHDAPGRLYAGVAATGRSMKAILLRTYATLLGAGEKSVRDHQPPDAGSKNPADVYTTVAGYFNSLRELGGMRRLVEDDVRTRCNKAEERRPHDCPGPHRWVRQREVNRLVELTSRESTSNIIANKAKLEKSYAQADHVDVLLASNMISVGVDIDRLGLMVVAGQPKTTAEYIQATSRVGRKTPGLVVTCFNAHKPRDRSHYEGFSSYHASFYRFVETTSLTPFSNRALDRGLAALIVAVVRLSDMTMTPNKAVNLLGEQRPGTEALVDHIRQRLRLQFQDEGQEQCEAKVELLNRRIAALLDTWQTLVRQEGVERIYSQFDQPSKKSSSKPLLQLLDPSTSDSDNHQNPQESLFTAPTSMRDVEGTVHLWLQRSHLGKQ